MLAPRHSTGPLRIPEGREPKRTLRNTFVPLVGKGVDCTFPVPVLSGPPPFGPQTVLSSCPDLREKTATLPSAGAEGRYRRPFWGPTRRGECGSRFKYIICAPCGRPRYTMIPRRTNL